jgi:putative nucleotidyltransferase with HDIG domain
MHSVETIEQLIPAITLLSDQSLRAGVATTWADVWDQSEYDSLDSAPETPSLPERPLLHHVNETNNLTLELMEFARKNFGLEPRHDVVLAAVILHDVDKLLMYKRLGDRSVTFAPGRSQADHGPVGATIAATHGVPLEICDLVRFHSPLAVGGRLPGNIEGTLVHYADLAAADFASVQYGAVPFHERTNVVRNEKF